MLRDFSADGAAFLFRGEAVAVAEAAAEAEGLAAGCGRAEVVADPPGAAGARVRGRQAHL